MSEKPVDDGMLEEFLAQRDPLSRRYREAASEQPSRELDDAILAAARRAVHAGPRAADTMRARAARRNWASRLGAPLAAAAVVVLAVALTVLLEREPEVMDFGNSSRQRPAATVPAPAKPTAPAESPAPKQSVEARKSAPQAFVAEPEIRDEASSATRERAAARADRERAQRLQQPATESDVMKEMAADSASNASTELKALSKSKDEVAPGIAPSAAAPSVATPDAPRRAAPEEAGTQLAPETRLAQIEILYDQGRRSAADQALAAFCRDFPDYRLPGRLLDHARRLSPDCAD